MRTYLRQHEPDLLALVGFFLLSWFYFGMAFGPHQIVAGDDWFGIANSAFGFYPTCTGTAANYVNPWRPFLPTPGCLSIRLLGTNPTGLYITGTVLYGLTAFGWYALLRKAFALPAWLAFAAGTIFLRYPDFGSQYIASSQLRIAGSAALITSTWAILTFWEKPRRWGWLVLGFGLALLGLLTYEVLLGLWIVGLPLMLLYKDRRITWRWAIATTGIIALVAAYLVWRLVLLPRTYTATTILAGGGASTIFLDPLNVLRQLAPLYVLVYQNLRSAIDLTIGVLASAEGGRLLALSLLAVGLAALILWRIGKRESPSLTSAVGRSLRESRTLFFAFWIAVPILALPFLFSTIATLRVG